MANPELGLKRTCVSCNARFYDLQRNPAVCPKCGTEQPTDTPRLRRGIDDQPDQHKPAKDDENTEDADLAGDDDAGDDVMEDTSDLDDGDDDLSNDIEVDNDRDNDEN